MNWIKVVYTSIIVLLYIPMVFMGANIFFPKYTGVNSYHQAYGACYMQYSYPGEKLNISDQERYQIADLQKKCQDANTESQRVWEDEKLKYEGMKYVFIIFFNLFVLLIALFVPNLQDTISMGLFIGSIGATFGATIGYFDTRSKVGFIILVITFFLVLFFINKKKVFFVMSKKNK